MYCTYTDLTCTVRILILPFQWWQGNVFPETVSRGRGVPLLLCGYFFNKIKVRVCDRSRLKERKEFEGRLVALGSSSTQQSTLVWQMRRNTMFRTDRQTNRQTNRQTDRYGRTDRGNRRERVRSWSDTNDHLLHLTAAVLLFNGVVHRFMCACVYVTASVT